VNWYFMSVMSTTCILQHALVCWVTTRLFKEKVKQWHDRRILKREFHVGEKVLLYRSRLIFFAGKLLSKWEGPFVIEEVYCSGAIKIASLKDNTTQVVNV
jgi:hypothetical protein